MAVVKDNLLSALCSSECSSLLILRSPISGTNLPSARVHDSTTVDALINAPLKNNYNRQRRLVRSEKNTSDLGGALFREAPSN